MRRMKSKLPVSFLLALALISLSVVPAGAMDDAPSQSPLYLSFTGTVKEIQDSPWVPGGKFLVTEGADGQEAHLILNPGTPVAGETAIEPGMTVTGWYDTRLPMLMIYPPRYTVAFLVAGETDLNVHVDHFGSGLVSSDNTLVILPDGETDIVTPEGPGAPEDLKNRDLAVLYGVSTRSIPAQTVPDAVYVLPGQEDGEEASRMFFSADTPLTLQVNGTSLEAPAPWQDGTTIMVPLRAVAEALGYTVRWYPETEEVRVGPGISVTIGQDRYVYMKTPLISLGTAPVLKNGVTWVPLNFFPEVLRTEIPEVTGPVLSIRTGQ